MSESATADGPSPVPARPVGTIGLVAGSVVFASVALGGVADALAQEEPLDPAIAAVDWPPSGQRLRELAERLDIEVGFAARGDWPLLPEADVYGAIAKAEFGILTPENSMKWDRLHPSEERFDFDDANDTDELVEFAEANGMRLHGHPLTWYLLNPAWLEAVPAERMEAVLRAHVDTVVSRYAGRVDVWDVVNEGLDDEGAGFREEDPFYAALGPEYMDIAFAAARAADPDAALLYNDFGIGWLTEKSALALELIDELLEREVPLDGIGMQMHIEHGFNHFEGFSEAMQRFADRELDVYITEFDVGVLQPTDYLVQADVYEEVIRRCLMQPRCEAVQIWGLNDFYSWRPYFRPLPFDDDFRVKPAYFGMQRALMTQPVHPESCSLDGARVASGTVYAASAGGDAFGLVCEAVPLDGGFTSLAVRYRNPGTDTPGLVIQAGETPLATIALAPVPDGNDGDFRTLKVEVPALDGAADLTLRVAAVSDAAEVGIDALLFGDPTRPLSLPGTDTAGGSGNGGGPGSGADGDSGAGDGVTEGGSGTDTGGSRRGGGASGPLWLTALGAVLCLGRRRRLRGACPHRVAVR